MKTKLSRAVQLIERVIRDGVVGEEDLARELIVRLQTLNAYRAGTIPMPMDRQLCLALIMIGLSGKYARMGYALREQLRAATRYEMRLNPPEEPLAHP